MPRKVLWKVLLVLGVIAVCMIPIYPPKEKIKLGLDLQGGAYIVMQVDTGSAIAYETGLIRPGPKTGAS